jgi:glutathione S-transferase
MRFTAPGILFVALVTLAAVLLYLVLTLRVAILRGRHKIPTPGTSGPPEFERAVRLQANTLEQIVPFAIGLWLCAIYLQPLFAAIVGVVWVVARVIYAFSYSADPANRRPGFAIGMIATVILVGGGVVGVVMTYVRTF